MLMDLSIEEANVVGLRQPGTRINFKGHLVVQSVHEKETLHMRVAFEALLIEAECKRKTVV